MGVRHLVQQLAPGRAGGVDLHGPVAEEPSRKRLPRGDVLDAIDEALADVIVSEPTLAAFVQEGVTHR